MSEPACLTALIHLSPESLKAYFRKKVSHAFGELVFQALDEGPQNFFIIKYLKKEQALFVHLFFGFAPSLQDLLESPAFAALQVLADFKDDDRPDRLVISFDASNFLSSPIEAGFLIKPKHWEREDDIPAAERQALDKLITRHFYAVAEKAGSYATAYDRLRIVETAIKRRVDRLLEARDLDIRLRKLPQATPLHPVRYGRDYFYNGKFVAYRGGRNIIPLPQFDPFVFRATAYGGADDRFVVVHGIARQADVASFKRLAKSETVYFADKDNVYDEKLNIIPGADGASFTLVHYAFARDKERWYGPGAVPLDDVGDFRGIDDKLYYSRSCILWGSHSVHLGATRLPLDAASARLIRSEQHRQNQTWPIETLWFEDKDGPLVAIGYSVAKGLEREAVFLTERSNKPQERLAALLEEAKGGAQHPVSPFQGASEEAEEITQLDAPGGEDLQRQAGLFENWLERFLPLYRVERPFDTGLWSVINNYFYCCWNLGRSREIIDLYERIGEDAWVNPYIFHHTACAYAKLGDVPRAVEEVRRALVCGYDRSRDMLDDPDLASLAQDEDFLRLRVWFEEAGDAPRLYPGQLLQRVAAVAGPEQRVKLIAWDFRRYKFPSARILAAMRDNDAAAAQAYEDLVTIFLNRAAIDYWRLARQGADLFRYPYRSFKDLSGLHPLVHLVAALTWFKEGFFHLEIAPQDLDEPTEFAKACQAVTLAKRCLEANPAWLDDPDWREFQADPCLAPLLGLVD